jgi:hypothetical protein
MPIATASQSSVSLSFETASPADLTAISDIENPLARGAFRNDRPKAHQTTRRKTGNLTEFLSWHPPENERSDES